MSERLTKEMRDKWRESIMELRGDAIDYDSLPGNAEDWIEDSLRLLDECDALERERDEARARADRLRRGRTPEGWCDADPCPALIHALELAKSRGTALANLAESVSVEDALRLIEEHRAEIDQIDAELQAARAREESVRSRMYEARVECAERMKRIYETLREEPSDPLSVELRIRDITLEPFPWEQGQ